MALNSSSISDSVSAEVGSSMIRMPASRDRAAEHAHQRRLARAVLAEQHVDLSTLQLERHLVQGADAGKLFADASHLQQRCGLGHIRHAKQAVSVTKLRPKIEN